MKKLIAACGILAMLLSANAIADRQELGTFGSWDTYRLTFPNGTNTDPNIRWVCSTRGFYVSDNGEQIKIIFAIYNTGQAKFYVESPRNIYPARYTRVVPVSVFGQNGELIFSANGRYSNDSNVPTQQIGFAFNVEFLKAIYNGFTLSTEMPDGRKMNFDISRIGLNSAIDANINSCLSVGELTTM